MNCDQKQLTIEPWKEESGNCPIDYCMRLMFQAKEESCGKCVLCREGTWQVYKIIKDISQGNPRNGDYELLIELLEQISENSSCEMASEAGKSCLQLMKEYEEEWDLHIRRKKCSNLVCKEMYKVYIDPNLCDGCGICLDECPEKAISGGKDLIHVIDFGLCKKSLKCIEVCPKNAVKKAGSTIPKLPEAPVEVGSFGNSESDENGEGRRRRRRN